MVSIFEKNFYICYVCVFLFCSIMNNLKDFGQKLDLNNYLFGSQSPEKTPSDKFVKLICINY